MCDQISIISEWMEEKCDQSLWGPENASEAPSGNKNGHNMCLGQIRRSFAL